MTAYVDTSCFVAMALDERGAANISRQLEKHEELLSSNLLEAELRAVLEREKVSAEANDLIAGISWVHPDRPLTPEFETVLRAGYLRGADLWHLAVALFVDPQREITFMTLDDRQKTLARLLQFAT